MAEGYTDSEGKVNFEVEAGTYLVTLSKENYDPQRWGLLVDGNAEVEITMVPATPGSDILVPAMSSTLGLLLLLLA